MTESREREDGMRLDDAIQALGEHGLSETPPPSVVAKTVEQLTSPSKSGGQSIPVGPPTRVGQRHFLGRRLTVAAAVVAVLAFVFIDRGPTYTFADVLDNVAKVPSVRFVCELGDNTGRITKLWLQDNRIRYEVGDGDIVMVIDGDEREAIELHRSRKVAKKKDLVGRVPAEDLRDSVEQLRNLKDQEGVSVTQLGDEKLGGQECHVFQVMGAKALRIEGQWTLWVDVKTGLPVQMKIGDGDMQMTFKEFVWSERFNEELFAMEKPEGYEFERSVTVAARPGQVYYHRWTDLHVLDIDEDKSRRQFVPKSDTHDGTYVPDRAELSPDGRFLAIGYTSHWDDNSSHPPDRVLRWDRESPDDTPEEIYARAGAELQHWRYSHDGHRLYVSWWEPKADLAWPHGMGAEVIDLNTSERTVIPLPTYKEQDGQTYPSQFAAASPDEKLICVVGDRLQLMTVDGQVVRSLTDGTTRVIARSVRFSPDGKSILFVRMPNQGYELCTVKVDGGSPKVLIPTGSYADIRARWSVDGTKIAYTCRGYDKTHSHRFGHGAWLRTVNADGSEEATHVTLEIGPNAIGIDLTAWR